MALPLIFFHQGFEPYLAFTLWQARQTNPHAPVYLLGDDTNDLSSIGVKHVRFNDCAGRAGEFVAAYHHLSGHELPCERLCFERWFYLDAFLQKSGIEEFCFFDSDYFLLMDLAGLSPAWAGVEMAGVPVWAFSYFRSREVITRFCSYVMDFNRDEPRILKMEAAYRAGGDLFPPEGIRAVSDMLLWMMFIRDAGIKHLDLRIPREGVVFDGLFDHSQGFRMRNGFKELNTRNGMFLGHHEATGVPARFAGLHFGGKYPKRLGPMFTGWPAALVRACSRPRYLRNWRKLVQMAAYCHRWRNKVVQGAEPGGSPRRAA